MTSLYDKFHSSTNIDHVYNLLADIFQKKYDVDIKKNINYVNYYNNKLREIFIKSDQSTIEGLNRELLSHHIKYFMGDIKRDTDKNEHVLERPQSLSNNKDRNDVESRYNDFMDTRKETKIEEKVEEKIPELSFDDLIKQNNEEPMKETPIKLETIIEQKQTESPKANISANVREPKPFIIKSSVNRTDLNHSKYNYKVSNTDELSKLVKLIIPIEKSLHFSSPILILQIPEFKLDIFLTCKSTYELNNYTVGIYEPEDHSINYNRLTDEITIIIKSIYDDSEYDSDIVKCQIEDKSIIVDDTNEYKVNDILCIHSNDKEFQRIIDIKDNQLEMECIDTDENIVSIMNMNLQHNLIFV